MFSTVKNLTLTSLLLLWLTGQILAEGKYFQNRLTLPDFPDFDVFVQTAGESQAAKLEAGKRWDISAKPSPNTTVHYLLVGPQKDLWVTISELKTPYGGKSPLDPDKFEAEFVSQMSGGKYTIDNKQSLKAEKVGKVGYYYLTDASKKHGTRLLYIPGARHGHYGDKRAYAVAVTHTSASSSRAKALLQKILDGVQVSK